MPNGRTHNRIVLSQVIAVSVGYVLFTSISDRILYCLGIVIGILISPDLDLGEHGNISNHYWRRVGWFAEFVWHSFWWLYGKMFKHRGLSHAPILGTLTRVVYMGIPIAIFFWLFDIKIDLYFLWPVLCGLCVADLSHILADFA